MNIAVGRALNGIQNLPHANEKCNNLNHDDREAMKKIDLLKLKYLKNLECMDICFVEEYGLLSSGIIHTIKNKFKYSRLLLLK